MWSVGCFLEKDNLGVCVFVFEPVYLSAFCIVSKASNV